MPTRNGGCRRPRSRASLPLEGSEHPTAFGWLAIALISIGVVSLAFRGRAADGRGIAIALCNAVVIASYTLVDGAGSGLALWAMTEAPVALVSALREASIVFGTLIAYFVLRERLDLPRLVATSIIVLGAIVLRLA